MIAYRIMTMACWVVVWLLFERIQSLEKEVRAMQDDILKLFIEVKR